MKPALLSFLCLTLFFGVLSDVAFAQAPTSELIPCGFDGPDEGSSVGAGERCTFDHLIILAQNVINFLILKIAAPLAAIMFAYAGFLYVTNKGNEAQIKKAHDIFLYVFVGFVVVLAAWLIVWFIINFFLDPTFVFLAPPA